MGLGGTHSATAGPAVLLFFVGAGVGAPARPRGRRPLARRRLLKASPRRVGPRAGVGRQGGERPDRDNGAHRAANADTMSRRQQTRRTRSRCRAPKRAPAPRRGATPTRDATGTGPDGEFSLTLRRKPVDGRCCALGP
jgi:hypothetical protein